MTYREITAIVIVSAPIILGAYDVWVYMSGGDYATISRTLLDFSMKYPLVNTVFSVGFGLLLGHLFLPQHLTEKNYPVMSKVFKHAKEDL